MASQSRGIKELMESEKEADKMVKNARKKKQGRLKAAVEEARGEIEKYRKEREKEFMEQQDKNANSKVDFSAKIGEKEKQQLVEQQASFENNKEEVIKRLMDLVFDIKADVHQNLKLKETHASA